MSSFRSTLRNALARVGDMLQEPAPTARKDNQHLRVPSGLRARSLRIYLSSHAEDRSFKDGLDNHLSHLRAAGKIETWSVDDARPGEDWVQRLTRELMRVDAALVLLSPDLLSSEVFLEMEGPTLFHRMREGVRIFPVLLRPCMWRSNPWFSNLKLLPHKDRPIASLHGTDRDQALLDVALEVERYAEEASHPTADLRTYFELYGSQQYLVAAKVSEAKNMLGAIARGLVQYMYCENGDGRRPERLPSAPLVPPKVPSGGKFIPDERTWEHPAWRSIKFAMTQAVYFSYEIVASPDGRTAYVRAHGDLAGNGKIVIYEKTVSLNADGSATISPELITREIFT